MGWSSTRERGLASAHQEDARQRQRQREKSEALVKELLHFLALKRALAFSVSQNELKVSPGWLVDGLWHKLLLETEVGGPQTVAICDPRDFHTHRWGGGKLFPGAGNLHGADKDFMT